MDIEVLDEVTKTLYRVTEGMDDEEPLKWSLRKEALRFRGFFDSPLYREEDMRNRILNNILFLLELAASVSYIAKANFDVLKREYVRFQYAPKEVAPAFVEDQQEQVKTIPHIPEFPTQHPEFSKISSEMVLEKKEDGHIQQGAGTSSRQRKIITFLGQTPNASVGDLNSALFKNSVSEKTLQRDLNDLMIQGVVRAQGDKRWRKYSLLGK